jgi:hypothetical protein
MFMGVVIGEMADSFIEKAHQAGNDDAVPLAPWQSFLNWNVARFGGAKQGLEITLRVHSTQRPTLVIVQNGSIMFTTSAKSVVPPPSPVKQLRPVEGDGAKPSAEPPAKTFVEMNEEHWSKGRCTTAANYADNEPHHHKVNCNTFTITCLVLLHQKNICFR